ncbi:hypothetical protein [Crateriforma conspicua]|uniref:hypothetical protein n=1 Tax=Crateriforma conspicua TaxID=2527996 RepID=UPI0011B43AB0|nr:hypothetical protein [Crateriforma conspicua]
MFGFVAPSSLSPQKARYYGEQAGVSNDPAFTVRQKVSMAKETLTLLNQEAAAVSAAERRVSQMQIAALLVETATHGVAKQLNTK